MARTTFCGEFILLDVNPAAHVQESAVTAAAGGNTGPGIRGAYTLPSTGNNPAAGLERIKKGLQRPFFVPVTYIL